MPTLYINNKVPTFFDVFICLFDEHKNNSNFPITHTKIDHTGEISQHQIDRFGTFEHGDWFKSKTT